MARPGGRGGPGGLALSLSCRKAELWPGREAEADRWKGSRFYQVAQAARSAARLKPVSSMRGSRGKRASLKETDPW